MPRTENQVISALRRPIVANTVFDLQRLYGLRLEITSDAKSKLRVLAESIQKIQARTELRVGTQVRIGLIIPSQSPFDDGLLRKLPAIRHINRVTATLGIRSDCTVDRINGWFS